MQRGPSLDLPFVEDPRADANGLLSLRSTLIAGALTLALTALLAFGPAGLFSVGGLVVTGPAGDATADPLGVEDEEDGLRVFVRGPRHLVPGYASRIEVRVSEHGATPALDGRRLQVTLDLDLEPEARGWVLATPTRVLVHPEHLVDERFELQALGEVPCGDEIGTLTVTATELVQDGRSVSTQLAVPGASCDEDVVPEAPETVHELEAPAPRTSSRPAPTPPSRAPSPSPEPREEDTDDDEADEADEADEDVDVEEEPDEPAAEEPDGDDGAEEVVEAPREVQPPTPDPEPREEGDGEDGSSGGGSGDESSGSGASSSGSDSEGAEVNGDESGDGDE
jgi:hypothetical protein